MIRMREGRKEGSKGKGYWNRTRSEEGGNGKEEGREEVVNHEARKLAGRQR